MATFLQNERCFLCDQSICVHVQNLAGDVRAYRVPLSAIVADLRRCVAERLGVTKRRVRLILPSDKSAPADLDDAATLAACDVVDETLLHLFVEDRVPCDVVCERVVGSKRKRRAPIRRTSRRVSLFQRRCAVRQRHAQQPRAGASGRGPRAPLQLWQQGQRPGAALLPYWCLRLG